MQAATITATKARPCLTLGPATAQELNGKHGRQEGEVPPEHLAEREAHGSGKGDPEGERMGLAGLFGLCSNGGGVS